MIVIYKTNRHSSHNHGHAWGRFLPLINSRLFYNDRRSTDALTDSDCVWIVPGTEGGAA